MSNTTFDAMMMFARSLKAAGVNPETVEVSLPHDEWQRLSTVLTRETEDMMFVSDENSKRDERFFVHGIRYKPRAA